VPVPTQVNTAGSLEGLLAQLEQSSLGYVVPYRVGLGGGGPDPEALVYSSRALAVWSVSSRYSLPLNQARWYFRPEVTSTRWGPRRRTRARVPVGWVWATQNDMCWAKKLGQGPHRGVDMCVCVGGWVHVFRPGALR
jgi:hypothetical protein